MTQTAFLARLLGLAVAGGAIALVLRLAGGPRWFGFYGAALAVLAVLPLLHRLLGNRLAEHGRRRAAALFVTLPLGLLAAVQVGYWAAFFGGSAGGAIQLGVGRFMVRDWLGPVLPGLGLALIAVMALFVVRLAAEPGEEAGGE